MSNEVMTVEQVKEALPPQFRKSVNDELVQQINTMLSDPDMYEYYRDNLISYTSVLNEGKFKVADYISAVKYCSFRIMGHSQIESYRKTFPDKYQKFVDRGILPKDIASYVTAYNKGKMVTGIMAQSQVPFHVLNQDLRQKALNKAAELMMSANSEKVQIEAANTVLTHTKPPETTKVELDIGVGESSAIATLREQTLALAAQQQQMVQAGIQNMRTVAESRIVAEVVDHVG